MADLSFKKFIDERSKKTKKRYFQFVSEVDVLMLYGEYVAWLADFSKRQKEAPKITANEMLVQLKIINAYHLHLIDKYKKSKSLVKPIEFTPVPEALMPEQELNPQFRLPPRNALGDDIENAVHTRFKHKFNLSHGLSYLAAILIFTAAVIVSFTINPSFFLWSTILYPTTMSIMAFFMIESLKHMANPTYTVNPAKSFFGQKNTFRPYEKILIPLLITVSLASALILKFVPLANVIAVPLAYIFMTASLFAPYICVFSFSKFLTRYNQPTAQKIAHQLQDRQNEEVIAPLNEPLLQQIDPLHQRHANGLSSAITATNHCLLSSRLSRKMNNVIPANDEELEELDITVLDQEVKRRQLSPVL